MLDSVREQYGTTHRRERTQHLTELRVDSTVARPIPGWLLDKLADDTMRGGWSAKQCRDVCDKCFEVRSVNGSCGCS